MKPATALFASTLGFAALGAAASIIPTWPTLLIGTPVVFVILLVLLRRRSDVPSWIAVAFSVAVLGCATTAATTAASVTDSLRGTSDGRQGIVTSVTSWHDVALVDLEARRSGPASAMVDRIPLRRNDYRETGKTWIDTATVQAVVPGTTSQVRTLAAARDGARGFAEISVMAAIALVLWGLAMQSPFQQRTLRILTMLGVVLLVTLPLASVLDQQLASLALQQSWIGDKPGGATFSFTGLIPGIVVLISCAVIKAGVRLRDEMELTI